MSSKSQSPFISRGQEPRDNHYVWDKDYVSFEHKDVVKKTGEGEDDYVLVTKHIEIREPISEVVARDADSCSIKAIMEQFVKTGDPSVLPAAMPKDGVTNDVTGVPDNLLDLDNFNKAMAEKYAALPDELKKGRSFAEFCELITQDEFMAFMASIAPKKEEADKKDGD